jgi:16S rRNA G966 N2-methylase RsmD
MARAAPSSFDLVFLDPPFDSALAAPALAPRRG